MGRLLIFRDKTSAVWWIRVTGLDGSWPSCFAADTFFKRNYHTPRVYLRMVPCIYCFCVLLTFPCIIEKACMTACEPFSVNTSELLPWTNRPMILYNTVLTFNMVWGRCRFRLPSMLLALRVSARQKRLRKCASCAARLLLGTKAIYVYI